MRSRRARTHLHNRIARQAREVCATAGGVRAHILALCIAHSRRRRQQSTDSLRVSGSCRLQRSCREVNAQTAPDVARRVAKRQCSYIESDTMCHCKDGIRRCHASQVTAPHCDSLFVTGRCTFRV